MVDKVNGSVIGGIGVLPLDGNPTIQKSSQLQLRLLFRPRSLRAD
jgi:hypothetical protein